MNNNLWLERERRLDYRLAFEGKICYYLANIAAIMYGIVAILK